MEKKRVLNADIAGAISDLQASMKEFILKHRLYRLLLRGKGLEFESYRSYAPDDDAASIDWKASKRANSLLVKQYRDERNLKVVFLLDMGENMVFGSADKLKCEYSAEIAAAFSYLINSTGDKPGFIFFSDRVKDYIKPAGGERHFSRIVDYITDSSKYSGFSNLRVALEFALNYLGHDVESLIIISDFLSFDAQTKTSFALAAKRFEMTSLMIRDPLDNSLPDISSEIVVQDPRTGQQLLINPKLAREAYEKFSHAQQEAIRKICLSHNVDLVEILTDRPFVPTLSGFLKGRIKQKPRVAI